MSHMNFSLITNHKVFHISLNLFDFLLATKVIFSKARQDVVTTVSSIVFHLWAITLLAKCTKYIK